MNERSSIARTVGVYTPRIVNVQSPGKMPPRMVTSWPRRHPSFSIKPLPTTPFGPVPTEMPPTTTETSALPYSFAVMLPRSPA